MFFNKIFMPHATETFGLKNPHQAHQNGTTVYEDQPFHHPWEFLMTQLKL